MRSVRKFKKLHAEMRPNLLAAGLSEAKADKHAEGKLTEDEAEGRYARLVALKEGPEYRFFMRIWTERTPEWWSNMVLLEQTDGVEFKVLRKAGAALRKAWAASLKKPTGGVEHEPESADAEARA